MQHLETATREEIEAQQLARLQHGLARILPRNRFYQQKFCPDGDGVTIEGLDDIARLPFTTKQELVQDQMETPLFGTNLTYPMGDYIRLHQTSGTTGRPLKIVDTQESWDWWADCWGDVYRAAGVNRDDIVFLAFGFGLFIGFWSAYEGARTYDHAGMTEMGAFGFACSQQRGIHVNESEFIAEILDVHSGQAVQEGEVGELVLTNLGRWGSPALRYRTGDLVRHGGYACGCGRGYLSLPGGILGRADDMLVVRGVNVYPSALADILHRFPDVAEYRIIVTTEGTLDEIALQVECPQKLATRIQEELHVALNLRIPIETVTHGSLPRFELKARRVEDRRMRG